MYVSQETSDETIENIHNTLYDEQFPFNVNIKKLSEDEILYLKDNQLSPILNNERDLFSSSSETYSDTWACLILEYPNDYYTYYDNPYLIEENFNFKDNSSTIESNLNSLYSADFTVTRIEIRFSSITEDDQLKYSFAAYTESNDEKKYIYGLTDSNFNVLADSYSIYLYDRQIGISVEEIVSGILSDECYAMPALHYTSTLFVSMDSFDTQDIISNIYTNDYIYLFVNENISDEELDSLTNMLVEMKFPIDLYINLVTEEEISFLREHEPSLLFDGKENINASMSELYKDTEYNSLFRKYPYEYTILFQTYEDELPYTQKYNSENKRSDIYDVINNK